MTDLTGRAVVVTGATGHLGRTVVGAFLGAGAHVAAPHRGDAGAEELRRAYAADEARLLLERADPVDEEAISRFAVAVVERWGRLDALAALVGGFAPGTVAESPLAAFRTLFDQNVATTVASIRAVLPHMRARGYGRIVCVGARPALRGARNMAAYSIAKTGVVRLVESLAEEVKDEGITVNAVLPSTLDTSENRRTFPKADPRKWVSPQEVAAAMVFLCSPQASGITGAAIPVFGRA